jgi:hypothetical protein
MISSFRKEEKVVESGVFKPDRCETVQVFRSSGYRTYYGGMEIEGEKKSDGTFD